MKKHKTDFYSIDKAMQKNAPFMIGVAQKLFVPFDNLCANMINVFVLDSEAKNKCEPVKGSLRWI